MEMERAQVPRPEQRMSDEPPITDVGDGRRPSGRMDHLPSLAVRSLYSCRSSFTVH